MNTAASEYSFDFAVSFAGTDRSLAERLAAILSSRGAVVFIDTLYRAHLVGKRLDEDFQSVFGPATKYFVAIVSKAYVDRSWPQHEWSIAIREAQHRSEEFILPLRLDDSLLVGLPGTLGYIDLRKQSLEVVADLLMEKLTGTKRAEVMHWVATFGVLIEDLLGSGQLPRTAPTDYPYLCDWLTQDLLARLRKSPITDPQITEESRNGETFSVRVGFNWKREERPLEFAALDWWDLLEVLPYARVYDLAE